MNRFHITKSSELGKYIIKDTHRWTPNGDFRLIKETAHIDKEVVEKEARRLNRGVGLEKYNLPNKG